MDERRPPAHLSPAPAQERRRGRCRERQRGGPPRRGRRRERVEPSHDPRELRRIERALDLLLDAITDHDQHREPDTFAMLSSADFVRQSPVESMLASPIGSALRLGVRQLGERLHDLGGTELMAAVCDRVANLDPGRAGRRTDIMDKQFDGIGGWWA